MKELSAMRFKGVPHRWKSRCLRTNKLFKQHGEVQSIPLVFRPDGSVKPDSPPIREEVEEAYPTPSLHPEDPALRFRPISLLTVCGGA
jgi:hypothetical protein